MDDTGTNDDICQAAVHQFKQEFECTSAWTVDCDLPTKLDSDDYVIVKIEPDDKSLDLQDPRSVGKSLDQTPWFPNLDVFTPDYSDDESVDLETQKMYDSFYEPHVTPLEDVDEGVITPEYMDKLSLQLSKVNLQIVLLSRSELHDAVSYMLNSLDDTGHFDVKSLWDQYCRITPIGLSERSPIPVEFPARVHNQLYMYARMLEVPIMVHQLMQNPLQISPTGYSPSKSINIFMHTDGSFSATSQFSCGSTGIKKLYSPSSSVSSLDESLDDQLDAGSKSFVYNDGPLSSVISNTEETNAEQFIFHDDEPILELSLKQTAGCEKIKDTKKPVKERKSKRAEKSITTGSSEHYGNLQKCVVEIPMLPILWKSTDVNLPTVPRSTRTKSSASRQKSDLSVDNVINFTNKSVQTKTQTHRELSSGKSNNRFIGKQAKSKLLHERRTRVRKSTIQNTRKTRSSARSISEIRTNRAGPSVKKFNCSKVVNNYKTKSIDKTGIVKRNRTTEWKCRHNRNSTRSESTPNVVRQCRKGPAVPEYKLLKLKSENSLYIKARREDRNDPEWKPMLPQKRRNVSKGSILQKSTITINSCKLNKGITSRTVAEDDTCEKYGVSEGDDSYDGMRGKYIDVGQGILECPMFDAQGQRCGYRCSSNNMARHRWKTHRGYENLEFKRPNKSTCPICYLVHSNKLLCSIHYATTCPSCRSKVNVTECCGNRFKRPQRRIAKTEAICPLQGCTAKLPKHLIDKHILAHRLIKKYASYLYVTTP